MAPKISNVVTLKGNVTEVLRLPWRHNIKVSDLIPSTEMLSIPTSPDSVIHRDWLLLDADAIIFLTTEKLDKSIDIAYSIYDIRAKKIVLKKKIYGVPDGLRQSSHYVSDGIYKHYYGIYV